MQSLHIESINEEEAYGMLHVDAMMFAFAVLSTEHWRLR